MTLTFTKYEALGNDFLLLQGPLPEAEQVRRVCDRRRGVGADGLLALSADGATVTMANADGSPAGFSGNGIRCAAWHRAAASDESRFPMTMGGRTHGLEVSRRDGTEAEVAVELEAPGLRLEVAPDAVRELLERTLEEPLPAYLVEVGNPHLVLLPAASRVAPDADLEHLRHGVPGYLGGINVTWLEVEGNDRARARTYERGVGLTPSCASAALACFLVGLERGIFQHGLQLHVPGGVLTLDGSADLARLRGPVRRVHETRWVG